MRPGELLLDTRRPAELLMTEAHVPAVSLAQEIVEAAVSGMRRFHARVFRGRAQRRCAAKGP